ncbi:TPA: RidA family protein [Klebsiella pneumoniae]
MKHVSTNAAPAAIGPYSQAMIVGNVVYTSGQIPLDPINAAVTGTCINEQTNQVIANLQEVLKAANSSIENVFKTTCFLANMSDFPEFNSVYERYFSSKPARSCVSVKELPRNVLIEIEVCALINAS